MIKLLLWDLDSTLLDYDIPERLAIVRCFETFNLGQCPQKFLDDYHAVNISWWEKLEKGELTKPQILVGRFEQMLSDFGYDPSIANDFNEEYMRRLGENTCPIEHSLETLRALKGKVIQGIATNGVRRTQMGKLTNSGIINLVDHVFISECLGADKPSLLFFERIMEQFPEISKNEILMVGDSLSSDMTGACNADIVSCWFNPDHLPLNRPLKIDYEIDDLRKVLEIVESKREE